MAIEEELTIREDEIIPSSWFLYIQLDSTGTEERESQGSSSLPSFHSAELLLYNSDVYTERKPISDSINILLLLDVELEQ